MEYSKQAEEFTAEPKEYDIPKEFPEVKHQKKKKKRSGMAAALLAGTMVLAVTFDYLLPFGPTDSKQHTQDPGISGEAFQLECGPGFATAAEALMCGDYISSAMCMVEAFQISYAEQEETQLQMLKLAYCDEQLYRFSGENLCDGNGVYIWTNTSFQGTRNDETGETYDFFHAQARAFFVKELENGMRELRAIGISIFLHPEQNYESDYGNGQYLQTVMDDAWNAETASLEEFTINSNDGYALEEELVGAYEITLWDRAVGPMREGHFCGEVQWWKDDVVLSADKTRFEYPDISTGNYYRLLMDDMGLTLAYDMGLADLTAYEYLSDEFVEKKLEIERDPTIPGAIFVEDDGTIGLYLKKVDPEAVGINYHGSDLLGYEWFPIINTDFSMWLEFEREIE